MNVEFERLLPLPMEVKEIYPVTYAIRERIERQRIEINKAFTSKDSRIVLIIGPCSADAEDSVMDYLMRLAAVQERVTDEVLIVPRLYTNKPRTTGRGYKGLLHQPNPLGDPDAFEGIIAVRELHFRAVSEAGFVCADEMLYPHTYQFLDDVLGYVAIGARSVENQEHRLVSSGVEVPVGMKNPTSGDLSVMMNSIVAAQSAHDFIYRGWEVASKGNPMAHAILRGFTDENGGVYSNYSYETVCQLRDLYAGRPELANPAVVVDCNHSNSNKRPLEQPRIAREVMRYREQNPELRGFVKGFMVESYLEDGSQKPGGGVYGKSITDPCLGWEKTERFIYELAEMA